ncbi:DUF4397 domain-containing protein [Chitinophaga sp. Cy-1792]|uniref:DUF4397 domain-containing protein n=1 Tax=Chitinophaga sp. Cy-1792 TaxID=2608339 RepID=UPI00141F1807|nr:DUF4397 domain-containing protein [Chitinophaga sp. Cy-1792]NIG57103.1 DUF4397 domain-containing protein [Chitinophaga sp. Cy-1792]
MKQLLLIVTLGVVLFAACKKDSDSAIPSTQSNFKFFNGVPGAVFGVKLDTVTVSSGVNYGEATAYKSMRAQSYNLTIINGNQQLALGQFFLRNGKNFTLFLGADTSGKLLTYVWAEDDLSAVPGDSARWRVVDLSDSYKTNNRSALPLDFRMDTTRVFRAVVFGGITKYANIFAPSNYTLNVNYVDSSKVMGSFPTGFLKGKSYTYVATGNANTTNFQVFQVQNN